jgi:hypothetical protein
MVSRRFLVVVALIMTATSFFMLGVFRARAGDAAQRAAYEARLDAIRAELLREVQKNRWPDDMPAGTSGTVSPAERARAQMVAEVKQALQAEMGLVPLQLVRDRRASFVELYATDNFDRTSYGTAGYLGRGYFITVKHAVVALKGDSERQGGRKIVAIKIMYQGREIPATVVDAGDADVEVHDGDWAIIKTRELDLPPLNVNATFGYEFAEPILRLGNDYSKGIILSTGYIGQRMANGLVSSLTDGHPGVSGGGVLDQRGDLVGIPIGRMQGDFRFSFILPIREEMFRKIPSVEPAAAPNVVVAVSAPAQP